MDCIFILKTSHKIVTANSYYFYILSLFLLVCKYLRDITYVPLLLNFLSVRYKLTVTSDLIFHIL